MTPLWWEEQSEDKRKLNLMNSWQKETFKQSSQVGKTVTTLNLTRSTHEYGSGNNKGFKSSLRNFDFLADLFEILIWEKLTPETDLQ